MPPEIKYSECAAIFLTTAARTCKDHQWLQHWTHWSEASWHTGIRNPTDLLTSLISYPELIVLTLALNCPAACNCKSSWTFWSGLRWNQLMLVLLVSEVFSCSLQVLPEQIKLSSVWSWGPWKFLGTEDEVLAWTLRPKRNLICKTDWRRAHLSALNHVLGI